MGSNATKHPEFQPEVKMWVLEEMINGKKLTEIINTEHENVKYLPGFKLPENVVSLINVRANNESTKGECVFTYHFAYSETCLQRPPLGRSLTEVKINCTSIIGTQLYREVVSGCSWSLRQCLL